MFHNAGKLKKSGLPILRFSILKGKCICVIKLLVSLCKHDAICFNCHVVNRHIYELFLQINLKQFIQIPTEENDALLSIQKYTEFQFKSIHKSCMQRDIYLCNSLI